MGYKSLVGAGIRVLHAYRESVIEQYISLQSYLCSMGGECVFFPSHPMTSATSCLMANLVRLGFPEW